MGLKAGIVGLPNVGKSTLFNAITKAQVEAANYPFATIEPNVGIVELQDKRINQLAKMVNPKKVVKATFQFIDIAGLVEGAAQGEGLGNKFLANIREVDAIIHVVRCFENENITHVMNQVNPQHDIEIINTELLLADIEVITKVISRLKRLIQSTQSKNVIFEYELARKLLAKFNQGIPARSLNLNDEEKHCLKNYQLLSSKPVIYIGNISEDQLDITNNPLYQQVKKIAQQENAASLAISASLESDLYQLDEEDQKLFLASLNLSSSGLDLLVEASFKLLNLRTYFTAGPKEVKAWTFSQGMKAPACAGLIHSDFERGFIKAEIVSYDDFIKYDGEIGAKNAGKYRLEGKNYLMNDGDIANFKFNV